MNAVQCPTMAAASGLSETMTLDDDSGAHEGNDEDNGDDAYGIESHGEQDAIARQVQLLLDLDRLGQIIARNRSNTANRCLACARDRSSMVGTTINRRDMNHSERNYEIQQLETSRHEAATAVCLSVTALDDASIIRALNHITTSVLLLKSAPSRLDAWPTRTCVGLVLVNFLELDGRPFEIVIRCKDRRKLGHLLQTPGYSGPARTV